MDDIDRWVCFDGPTPEPIRSVLEAPDDLEPLTPEEEEAMARALAARIGAAIESRRQGPPEPPTPRMEQAGAPPPSVPAVARPAPAQLRPAHSPAAPGPYPLPPYVRPPAALAGTSELLELPRSVWEERGKLPFGSTPSAAPTVSRTLEAEGTRAPMGGTTPLGDDSVSVAVASLPFIVSIKGDTFVTFPRLTLERYASLRADLAWTPPLWAAILERYKVANRAAYEALVEHWDKALAAEPGLRTKYESALAQYMDYLINRAQ
jgi:hypothetical protein